MEVIMQLIVHGGTARSKAMEAIRYAKEGDIAKANELIIEATDALEQAHDFQSELIQNEADGNKVEISLLMVHAQDHLMNAMTIKDLAKEFVDMYEQIKENTVNK